MIATQHTPEKTPPGPRGKRIVGMIPALQNDILGALQEAAAYGDVVRLPVLNRYLYLVNHPDYIKHVLVDNHRNYHKGRALQATRSVIGNGILTSEGDFHKRQRRMIQPAFHRRRISVYADVMTEYTEEHMAQWRDGDERDLHHELMTLTMGIVAKCLFDTDVRHDAGEIGAALEGVFDTFSFFDRTALGVIMQKLPLPRQRKRQKHTQVLDDAIYKFIRERRAAGKEAMETRDDLLSMLLLSVDEEGDGTGMTDQQARDEVMTLFLAGHETTANALSWTMYLLVQHPGVADKLRAEYAAVLDGRTPTINDLQEMKYNKMVFSEAMRLYPPAWAVGRTALNDDVIGGYHVPAGSTVLMSQYVMHRHPDYWNAPHLFRPERFDPQIEDMNPRPRYAYFPFGGGPRLCIGEPFAWMEGELLLATIFQKFDFTVMPGAIIEPEPLVTLRLKYGLPVTIGVRG